MNSISAKTHIDSASLASAHTSAAYRKDIDGLRAIAVIAVLIFHAFPEYLPGGFVGVDIFFVISGFLISGIIELALGKGQFSFADFYVKRIRRIFPALIVMIVTCFAFGERSMISDDFTLLARDVVGGSIFSSNLFYWSQAGYFAQTATSKPLLHLWSLGIEEQFYIFWPVLLYIAATRKISAIYPILLIGILSFLVNVIWIGTHPVATFYSPLSRAWELAIGAGVAHLVNNRVSDGERSYWSGWASAVGICLVAVSVILIKESGSFPGWQALFPVLGTALILFAVPSAGINARLFAHPVMTSIGRISYPLYLWHWPLLVFARSASPSALTVTDRVELLVASFVLAAATERFIERPIRTGPHRGIKIFALVACMIAVGSAGAYAWKSRGFPSPYPDSIQQLTRYDLDAFRNGIRRGRCFFEPDQSNLQFAPECVDAGTAPLWMIWGDSGAAAIYQGFRTLASSRKGMRLAQFTRSGCPPIVGYNSYPGCVQGNTWVLDEASRLHPDVAVLAAIWGKYNREGLPETISALKRIGVKRIIVLGPTPAWTDSPAHLLTILWKADIAHRLPGARLDYNRFALGQDWSGAGLDMRTSTADKELRLIASQAGVEYINPSDALCTVKGCLTRASDESRDPFYLDIVHLTQSGANYAVAGIADELMRPASVANAVKP